MNNEFVDVVVVAIEIEIVDHRHILNCSVMSMAKIQMVDIDSLISWV